ncbi:MAG: VOC family protein [bacterium]|nr:VOC family protein [bacterium]
MLANAPITTILPVIDMDRACDFYENKLGLAPQGMKPDGKFVYACAGGSVIALFTKEGGTCADHTAVSFRVDNINDAIITLQDAGVEFDDYDLPGLKTTNHVCVLGSEKAAWFHDTEGNALCIHEDIKEQAST